MDITMDKEGRIKMTRLYESIEAYNRRKLKELDNHKKFDIGYHFEKYQNVTDTKEDLK